MSFSAAGSSAQNSEINVTPLIDVLLVLLIIFMVIVPVMPNGLRAASPQATNPLDGKLEPDPATVVVGVHAQAGGGLGYTINDRPIAKAAVVSTLTGIFALRQQRTLFVKGDAGLEFGSIAEVISLGHQADVTNIGIITRRGGQGQ